MLASKFIVLLGLTTLGVSGFAVAAAVGGNWLAAGLLAVVAVFGLLVVTFIVVGGRLIDAGLPDHDG
jgi:hypothetical protein